MNIKQRALYAWSRLMNNKWYLFVDLAVIVIIIGVFILINFL